jgi:hypothetical protein
MTLPPGGARHFIDRCALQSTQHRDHRVLLRWALRVRWRLRQGFDCRPQLIDQRPAVANLPPFLDTRQSIPQGQQPLAVERGGVRFLVRGDGNLRRSRYYGDKAGPESAARADALAAAADRNGAAVWRTDRPVL